jgi:hypothetical protein
MKLTNDIKLLAYSMGKLFRVTHICVDTTLANKICEQEPNSGVMTRDASTSLKGSHMKTTESMTDAKTVRSDALLALWVTAFEAFQSASTATRIGDIPGGGFDHAARMWDGFEKIVGHLKANNIIDNPLNV